MAREFIHLVRVYFEDMDDAGVVYHANYLKYMERARSELFRDLNITFVRLMDNSLQFVMRAANVEFLHSAHHDDLLHVVTTISRIGHTSIQFEQIIVRENQKDLPLCKATNTIVLIDEKLQPIPLPEFMLTELKRAS